MKKIFSILTALLILCTASYGQTAGKQKIAPKTTKAAPKATAKPTAAKPATKTKKDGTPDMRYKANKATAKPAGPLKKDGTPDKRYKANKTVTPKTK